MSDAGPSPWSALLADAETRRALWRQVAEIIEQHTEHVAELRVAPPLSPDAIRHMLAPFDFSRPLVPADAVAFAAAGLTEYQVYTPHPRYFAAFNPQIAAWSHSPFAAEVERHVLRAMGSRFGYTEAATDGTFASGGAEANHTAVLVALAAAFPQFGSAGVRALPGQPRLYTSGEAHHSFRKAARM